MPRRTKIICTIGPASRSSPTLRKMIAEGMDVARLNFSHGTLRGHTDTARAVRAEAAAAGREVRILADLQGPKLRIGVLDEPLRLGSGDEVVLDARGRAGEGIPVPDRRVLEALEPADRVFLDDGAVELEILDGPSRNRRRAIVRFGGTVDSNSGITIRGKDVDLPALSEKDIAALEEIQAMRADLVAQSMVRCATDVEQLRARLGATPPIVAKIESGSALGDLEGIARLCAGLMVARGDLGVSIPRAEVPLRQKEILDLCRRRDCFGIVATEMLLSMVTNSRPTRAEVSDVATAILDGADALMLSEETAIGSQPALAVREMRGIIETVESSRWYRPRERPTGL